MRHGLRRRSAAGLMVVAAALAGCRSSVPPSVPLDQLNPKQRAGHGVFQARCEQCHYDRQSGDLNGPSLVGVYKRPYLPSGTPANDDRVSATVLHGRNMMPPQGDALGPGDLDNLLAYLHTL